jgi:hypothetical protein
MSYLAIAERYLSSTNQDASAAVPPAVAAERPYDINDINDQSPPVYPAPVLPADDDAAFEAFVCRAIEQDQDLPTSSLELRAPCDLPHGWLALWQRSTD